MRISDYFVPEHWIADVDRDDEQSLAEIEREAEWERQQRAADAWREATLDDGEAPWDWGPADEARIERAVSEVRRDLGLPSDDEPF
jgi:hypothetical protein